MSVAMQMHSPHMHPIATLTTPGAYANGHPNAFPASPSSSYPFAAAPAAGIDQQFQQDDSDHSSAAEQEQEQEQEIPFTTDTVHSTWSEFTKKKNVRAELTRLENISWRIWHALRLRAQAGRPQPRFAVKVDAATACFVDPQFATPSANQPASAASPPMSPTSPHSLNNSMPPPSPPAPSAAPNVPLRKRKQSLQVDPRLLASFRKPAPQKQQPQRQQQLALPAPSAPSAPAASAISSNTVATPTSSSSSSSRPFIVVTLPASLLDRPRGSPYPIPPIGSSARTRYSGAASPPRPSSIIKRTDRQVDLQRYFGIPSSVRMLTGPAARAALCAPGTGTSPPGTPSPVLFLMGGNGAEEDDLMDDDDIDEDAYRRISLDETRSTYFF